MVSRDDDAIRQRAYAHWEQDGKPEGRHAEHWERAENELSPQLAQPKPATSKMKQAASEAADGVLKPAARRSSKAGAADGKDEKKSPGKSPRKPKLTPAESFILAKTSEAERDA